MDKQKALKTKRPDEGLSRPGQLGKGGTIGATGGSLLTQHVLKQQASFRAIATATVSQAFSMYPELRQAGCCARRRVVQHSPYRSKLDVLCCGTLPNGA